MDPARRRTVEDDAHDQLMAHLRDRGWTVRDVRFGNPYDAIATRNGRTLWLCVVYGPQHEETREVADVLSRLRFAAGE